MRICQVNHNHVDSRLLKLNKFNSSNLRSGLTKLMSVLDVEIASNASISAETESLLAKIDERERNIENLKSELHFI